MASRKSTPKRGGRSGRGRRPDPKSSVPEPKRQSESDLGIKRSGRETPALPPADEEASARSELLDQFYANLRVVYLAARGNKERRSPHTEIYAEVEKLLGSDPSWRAAYEIEQLLSIVMTEEQLDAELARRFAEAKSLELPYVDALKERYNEADKKKDAMAKRAVLQRLLNDLQWFYTMRMKRRGLSKKLALRESSLFLTAFMLFFLVLFIQFFSQSPTQTMEMANDATSMSSNGNLVQVKGLNAKGENNE